MANHLERATKVCPVCGRPFQWRKKWKDVWEEVRYCSERCRRRRSRAADPLGAERAMALAEPPTSPRWKH
jgi:hypothetical protein